MKLAEAINQKRTILARNDIEDASLEAELLLRHVLKIDRTRLYLDLDNELSQRDEKAFGELIERRLKGEPSAYITRHREFYGREFYVNPHTLIPRPESELLVETTLRLVKERQLHTIADIGTGCGAIAITLALEIPNALIYATDISPAALEVASLNCQRHGVANGVRLLQGDMLAPLPQPLDLIVANLPYVKRTEIVHGFEPSLALDGGVEGTEMIAKLCRQAKDKLTDKGWLLLEIGQGQSQKISTLLKNLFHDGTIDIFEDFSGIERVVSLNLSKARVAR